MTIDDLIDRLQAKGLNARAYRGRNMCSGGHCAAVVIPALRDLVLLGPDMHEGLEVDSYAREFIAYWPDVSIPATHDLLGEQDDYD